MRNPPWSPAPAATRLAITATLSQLDKDGGLTLLCSNQSMSTVNRCDGGGLVKTCWDTRFSQAVEDDRQVQIDVSQRGFERQAVSDRDRNP